VLLRQMTEESLPIAALFDHDENGKAAAWLLRQESARNTCSLETPTSEDPTPCQQLGHVV
jgi:hypothetical protein